MEDMDEIACYIYKMIVFNNSLFIKIKHNISNPQLERKGSSYM